MTHVSTWTLEDYRAHYRRRWLRCIELARINYGTRHQGHWYAAADAVLDRWNRRLQASLVTGTFDA